MAEKGRIFYGKNFLRDAQRLPKEAQQKLASLLEILADDPFDPRLHGKALGPPLRGKFSFRITRDWRVGFEFLDAHTIHLLAAERRDRIYKRLERLR